MAENVRLTPKEQAFAAAWLVHHSTVEAAAALGLSDRQGRRYMARPAVRAAISQAQDELVRRLAQKALAACERALGILEDIAGAPETPAAAQVMACRTLLSTALDLYEQTNLASRVAALEEVIAQQELGRGTK